MKVLRCFLLGVLLAAGTSLAVDVNWLTGIVKAIRREYKLEGHFCVAAAIPLGQDANTLAANVLHDIRFHEGMADEIKGGLVLEGSRVILAAPAGPVHAEYSVLKKLNKLNKYKYKSDFLLIYSYISPCSKCADWKDRHTILEQIYNNIEEWSDGAFVFTKVYDKPNDGSTVPRDVLKTALKNLAQSMGGHQYIFRCDGPNISDLECHSCSINDRISDFCIDNNGAPDQAGSSGSERGWSESRSSSEGMRSRSSSEGRRSRSSSEGMRSRSSSEGRRSRSSSEGMRSRSSNEGRRSRSSSEGRRSRSSSEGMRSRSSSEGMRSRSSSEGMRSRSSSESRDSSRNRGGGSSRKRHIYRSQSESSISSSESRRRSSRNSRKVGKNKGGGSMSRKRGKYGSQNESRSSRSSG